MKPLMLAQTAIACMVSPGADYLDLGGSWNVSNANNSYNLAATVPGFVQTDLYNAGILPDPVYGTNFEQYNWIPQEDWTFTRALPDCSPNGTPWGNFSTLFLVFQGIDTQANITMGTYVGSADNMFRQWIYKVTPADSLSVTIYSPIKTALATLAEIGSPWTEFTNYATVYPEGREYIRKVQSDFGWDWGPHFAPSGIYRDAYLVGLNDGVFVTNTFIDIHKPDQYPNIDSQSGPWQINASVDFLATEGTWKFCTTIEGYTGKATIETITGINRAWLNFTIPDDSVERWWPHTAATSAPRLYNASLALTNNDTSVQWSKQIGFRTITLDLAANDNGRNFHFIINGQAINAKGSNMVPLDPFETQVTPEDYEWLLKSSVASNYNMLRVWSSGNYYADAFYEAADRAGVMLWNEFQFSDNYYPATPDFLANVRQEVDYQIRRLNHHPSASLWCGGNELSSYRQRVDKNTTYADSWHRNTTILQQDVLWPSVYENTRSISWVQASDAQGYTEYDPLTGYIVPIDAPGNGSAGPGEDYNLGLDTVFNNSYLHASRFMVEFGAISYDSYSSFQTIFDGPSIDPNGTDLLSRCYDGGSTIYQDTVDGIARYYVLPSSPADFFWSSQIWQGEIIKYKIESHRRGIGLPENDLGSLVWQLNAPWTTTALNTIEKTGRWKVLQYMTKQVFEPVVVSSWFEPLNSTYNVWVASDLWESVQGQVEATWYDWSGNVLEQSVWPFTLDPLDSKPLWNATGWDHILPANASTDNAVLLLRLDADNHHSENYFVPNFVSNATLVDPGVQVDYLGDLQWNVTATTGVSAYTWLDAPSSVIGFFSDNSMWLAKGESRTVNFTLRSGTEDGWGQEVTVRSIRNNK